jgi:hypothetical protein
MATEIPAATTATFRSMYSDRYVVWHPAPGFIGGSNDLAEAKREAQAYRRFANLSNTYGGPVAVYEWDEAASVYRWLCDAEA